MRQKIEIKNEHSIGDLPDNIKKADIYIYDLHPRRRIENGPTTITKHLKK